ncbi:hypothetical protein VP01_8962g1 [Puccinia sorghi]|uniref:SNF2 N-terminal domain-containing protein n=1 Tax=Puccinia sorghi TaxID=27349 RepID=A0A0L6U8L5_9BASI|nr:hypothetical protein VP01_8962g1 [Puccinia sorghi]
MEIVCLQRTKQVILNLPKKVKKAIMASLGKHWEEYSKDLHEKFIHIFGRLCTAGQPWDPTKFFKQLTRIRQYCNHPMFVQEVIPTNAKWAWQDLGKLVHLVQHLKGLLNGEQRARRRCGKKNCLSR